MRLNHACEVQGNSKGETVTQLLEIDNYMVDDTLHSQWKCPHCDLQIEVQEDDEDPCIDSTHTR